MKIKNFLISNDKNLRIKKLKKVTTDIHLYNHNNQIEKIFFKKSPFRKNYKDYKKDYDLIRNKSLIYSKNIRVFLNKYHNFKYSNYFWDKLLNEQIYRFTLCIYDFYKEFNSIKNEKYLSNVLADESFVPPKAFSEIWKNFENDNEYREQLLKIFLENFDKKKIKNFIKKKNEKILYKKNNDFKEKISIYYNYLTNFDILYLVILNKIKKKIFYRQPIKMGIIKSYFHIKYRLILENNSNLKIRTMNFPKIYIKDKIDYSVRKNLSSSIVKNDKFDSFFKESIKFFFPQIFLETFKINEKNSLVFYKTHKHLKYIVNESFISDDYSALNLAIGREFFNTKHIYNEHNYLNYLLFGNRISELSNLVDKFYSIGWKNKNLPNVKQGANLSILRNPKKLKKKINILLFTTNSYSRKPHFVNYISKEGGFNYYNQTDKFLKNLNKSIQKDLVIKLHPSSQNTIGFNYFFEKVKKFKIEKNTHSTKELMLQSKIIILDHYSTSFIEVLKYNIPFILILDKKFIHRSLLKSVSFENLIKNNIVHDCPLKASKFLNKHYDNYLKWWNSEKVLAAVKNFTKENIGDEIRFINKLVKLAK